MSAPRDHAGAPMPDAATPAPAPAHAPGATVPAGSGAVLGAVLRTGVVASVVLIVSGVLWGAADGTLDGGSAALEDHLHAGTDPPTTLGAVWRGVLGGRPQALVALGLLVLIATPVVRVAVAGLDFRRRGDRTYAGISAAVLALLAISLLAGTA